MVDSLRSGKRAKGIISDIRQSCKGTTSFQQIPNCKQVRNLKYSMSTQKETDFGMKFLSDIKDFIEQYMVSTEVVFNAKGSYYYLFIYLITSFNTFVFFYLYVLHYFVMIIQVKPN